MKEININYYEANPKFRQKLIETGSKELIHTGFRIDPFWGQTKNGGENQHGKILMESRANLKGPKKLTKEGKKWVKGAIKDMKEREK